MQYYPIDNLIDYLIIFRVMSLYNLKDLYDLANRVNKDFPIISWRI